MTTRAGFEVDFAVDDALVQVCADPAAPDVRERELRALDEAMEELDADESVVVTLLHEERVKRAGNRVVRFVPAWRWLLER